MLAERRADTSETPPASDADVAYGRLGGRPRLRPWGRALRRLRSAAVRPGFRVSFLVAGVQKGGTTALDSHLAEHPQIGMAATKEPGFFDHPRYFRGRRPRYGHYHGYFFPRPGQRAFGEATPYFHQLWCVERIRAYNPDMRVVVLLRDPVARAFSNWNMERQRGMEPLSFPEAIRGERARLRAGPLGVALRWAYLQRSLYADAIRHWWRVLGRDQVLFVRSEALRERPAETLGEICAFLGVEPLAAAEPRIVHQRPRAERLAAEDRAWLLERCAPDVREVERLLGWDCSAWLA